MWAEIAVKVINNKFKIRELTQKPSLQDHIYLIKISHVEKETN